MPIWTDNYLSQLEGDARQQINQDLQCIFYRFYLPVQLGKSVYTLPSYLRSIRRITWLGRSLDADNFEELQFLTPATAVVNPNAPQGNIESVISRPLYYVLHPTNPYDIRLFPTPNDTFDFPNITSGDPYSPTLNERHCTVSCWRTTDDSLSDPNLLLPPYIERRTVKAYVAWKAFLQEGKGQNLTAAKYYEMKYKFLIEQFMKIDQGAYISKRYMIDDGELGIGSFRYPRPQLNPNFERTLF